MLLEEIVSKEDDITEPACMERLLAYLDELQLCDEAFMQSLLDKLGNEEITWHQPWYQKIKCLTRPLSLADNDDKLETFRTDTICNEEGKQIEQNWQKLRKKHNLPDTLICFARWKIKKSRNPNSSEHQVRSFLTAYLAKGLERNLNQVYRYVLSTYGAPNKGQYTATEERIIDMCFNQSPKNAVSYLTTVLGREPRGIYKRLQQNFNGGKAVEKKKMKWTLFAASELLKLLLKYTGQSLDALENEKIDKRVWLQIQDHMNHHYVYLQSFWYKYLHNQLYVKFDVRLKKLRKKVLKRLRTYHYQVWGDIRWKAVQKDFPSFTHTFLYRIVSRLARTIPGYREIPLDTLVSNCLQKNKISRDARLKTLKLNEHGVLEKVEYYQKMEL